MQPVRDLFARFFPKRLVPGHEGRPPEERLALGELALNQGNIEEAIGHFEAAPRLAYAQGVSLLEFSLEEKHEKGLHAAARAFRIATSAKPNQFEAWFAWGIALFHLGRRHQEHHYYLDAKEKFETAALLLGERSRELTALFHWKFGLLWSELALQSGEAVDVREAIDNLNRSLESQKEPSPRFLLDQGNAYLHLGLLTNDERLYQQSIDALRKATDRDPNLAPAWSALAGAYSQLYVSTLDERYAGLANDTFARLSKLAPREADGWVAWGQLLGETGRHNRDPKKLKSAVERSAYAHTLDPKNPFPIAQWVESLSLLGALTSRLDLLIEAEDKVQRAIEHFEGDAELSYAHGLCLHAFGDYYSDPDYYDQAIEKLQECLSYDRSNAEGWHALGNAHYALGKMIQAADIMDRAIRFHARAIDLKPSCPALLFDAANALLVQSELRDTQEPLEQALRVYESLLKNQKEAVLHHPEWLYHYAVALDWYAEFTGDENHLIRSIDLLLHVLLINPDYPHIHLRVAAAFVRLGEVAGEAEYYARAHHYFQFAARSDEEEESVWLEWGLALINLAHYTPDPELMNQYYFEAEAKILRAGQLGHPLAHYQLACLYSILGRYAESMDLIRTAQKQGSLPPLEELLEDLWLENLRGTEVFAQFLSSLEAKQNPRSDF